MSTIQEFVNETEIPSIKDQSDPDGEAKRRAALSAKFDEAMSRGDEPEADDEPELEATDETETPAEKTARERDEHGRFVAKKDPQAQVSGQEQTIEDPAALASQPAPAAAPPVLAPASWAPDEREAFAQAPRKAQEAIIRRETESRRAIQQATEKAAQVERTWAEVREAIGEQRMELLGRRGATPGMAVKQLMHWQDYLDRDPPAALRDLAQTYGLDLLQVAQHLAEQPQEPAYVRELRQQNQQILGLFQQQQTQVKTQQEKSIEQEIMAFSGETDASGQLLRPHVEQLIDDMLPFLNQHRGTMPVRQLLQTAYDKALWANPSTRELELNKVKAPNLQNIEKARRAAKLVNGDARSQISKDEPSDPRTRMAAVYDKRVK